MGNTQTQQNYDFLLDNFVKIREQNGLKLLQDTKTKENFALREICFVNRTQYDRNFRQLAQRDNTNCCENILELVKLWSKEHNGVCSNLFKIYTVYEYPKVRLIDEIQARKKQRQYFQQIELFNILQSCLNAYTADSSYINISPYLIFIIPEGILKLVHPDLIDINYRTVYNREYYYSPQKIANFNCENQSAEELEKESIFSLGMTLLHAALLESPTFCYEISARRFNHRKLQILLSQLTGLYSKQACDLFSKMLEIRPYDRFGIDQVQTLINQYFSGYHETMRNSQRSQKMSEVHESIKYENEVDIKSSTSAYLNQQRMNQSQSIDLALHSNIKTIRPSQFQINMPAVDESIQHLPKNHHILLKSKKNKQTRTTKTTNKENVCTDSKQTDFVLSSIGKTKQQNHPQRSISILTNQFNHETRRQQTGKAMHKQCVSEQSKGKCTFVIQHYHDNTRYEGMLQNNKKNGYGKLIYPDGVFYQGNFKNDMLHGKGSLFYGKNRPAYVGDWSENKFHGKGTLYNSSLQFLKEGTFNYRDFNKLGDGWAKYEGNFNEDIKQGPGKIYLTSGETMQGIFECGLLNGQGIFTEVNSNKIYGKWVNNIYESPTHL